VRYPNLRDNILNILPPVELAARMARHEAMRKNPELKREDIGIIFITPCPAKASYAKNPDCVKKSEIDGVIAMSDIYLKLVSEMKKININQAMPIMSSGVIGISWANSGGESSALLSEKYLAADGISNVIKVLDQIEVQSENFLELDFIELNACSGGCVGGVLAVENTYIAKARIQKLRKYLPISQNYADKDMNDSEVRWENEMFYNPALKLNEDTKTAVKMMIEMEKLIKNLPAIDCGACGAPSCKALAEDIVRGEATESDCVIKIREKMLKEVL
jgi:iron only hydrogenase large subunit-like protein